jgi:Ca-activated chloride channel family protein
MRNIAILAAAAVASTLCAGTGELTSTAGPCPLEHTDVKAQVSGPLTRVTVTQKFVNPYSDKIEAVYTFPLPQNAAVDDMKMLIGNRVVRGDIKRREEARKIYEKARAAGHLAGLLDQERPNIFTQSVANIMPGEQVQITISYVETLKYTDGTYEFMFPMVVGPRYIPGSATGHSGGGWAPDTDRVPDASRITPPVTPSGTRAGHDISLEVALDSGVPFDSLASATHDVKVVTRSPHEAVVALKDEATLPNRDFILRWQVAGSAVADAVLTHHGSRGGFFTLILQPPERVAAADAAPKELVFVLDTSGSMSGFPIEKAKEAMRLAIDGLNPQDTFNLITFSGATAILFPEPVPATPENLRVAKEFLAGRHGSGGTEMMKAIRAALDPSDDQNHVRIVCFMTDGYVGNDMEIIGEVQRHPNARVFAFGIGSSVNRFLLDNMARYGRGEVEYVGLQDDGSAAARRFHERVSTPLLTDISIDWGGLPVADVQPQRQPDLFAAKPLVINGRYTAAAHGVIRLHGYAGGRLITRTIDVNLPAYEPRHDVVATLWASARIDDLMSQDWQGAQNGTMRKDLREAITQLGLDYRLMTQFTSFVEVEERTVTEGGQPRRIDVPVEMPDGVSYEGVFGRGDRMEADMKMMKMGAAQSVTVTSASEMIATDEASASPAPSNGLSARRMRAPAALMPPPPPPPVKLSPALAALAARAKAGTAPTLDDLRFLRDGKVTVRLWLDDASDAALAQLKALGFEVTAKPDAARVVIGRIAVARLDALSQLACVRYVEPWEARR